MRPNCINTFIITIASAAFFTRNGMADNGYTLTTLANFNANNNSPGGNFVRDIAGNFYGTSILGGASSLGTVYKADASNGFAITTVASLDGPMPNVNAKLRPLGVVMDAAGNLYGTTAYGGISGKGTIFKVDSTPSHNLTTLITFDGTNGQNPAGLFQDQLGNYYAPAGPSVYEMTPAGGYLPSPVLTLQTDAFLSGYTDAAGNLYGWINPTSSTSSAVKFDAAHNYSLSTLGTTQNSSGHLSGSMAVDSFGNIYGSTYSIGISQPTVFKLNASNNYSQTILASFPTLSTSVIPSALIVDNAGNIFGVTSSGGTGNGTVFELVAANNYQLITLVNFTGANGAQPVTNLILDASGKIYGQTSLGGAFGDGTIFMLTPTAVPEPCGLAILGWGFACLLKRRYRVALSNNIP